MVLARALVTYMLCWSLYVSWPPLPRLILGRDAEPGSFLESFACRSLSHHRVEAHAKLSDLAASRTRRKGQVGRNSDYLASMLGSHAVNPDSEPRRACRRSSITERRYWP